MPNHILVHDVRGAAMPRRQFLRNSMLLALPGALLAAGIPLTAAAAAYAPASRARGLATLDARTFGATGNGTTDDTAALQAAVDALPSTGGTVFIPDGTYLIDPTVNLRLRSNMHLQLSAGAILQAKRNSADRAYVLMVYKVSNVEISGGRIIGERDEHLGTTGEWGHAIMVRGSERVTIRDIHLSRCWGDGISIGAAMVTGSPYIISNDVVIANVVSTGNRRQGLSVGRASNVKVYDSEFSNTHGIGPSCGIDVEPDNADLGTTTNVHIENCVMRGNAGNGLMLYKRVSGVTVKRCTIQHNGGHGVLVLAATGGYLAQNNISHNFLVGVMVNNKAERYQFSGNTYRNNHTRLHGVNSLNNPTTALVGLVGGNKGNGAHIQVTVDCPDIRVTTNYFAK